MSLHRRKSLLAVFPVAPWPVRDNGVSVRFYPLLRALAQHHDVDVVVLSDFRDTLPDDELLRMVRSVDVHYFNRARPPGLWRRLRTWLKVLSPFGPPYEYASYCTPEVVQVVRAHTARHRYDTLLWVCPHYREALDRMRHEFAGTRIVFDCVDSPLLHYVRSSVENRTRSLITRLDQWKTRYWERKLASGVDVSVYISPVDAAAAFAGGKSPSVVVPNGVYLDDASGDAAPSRPDAVYLGFLGHMGYTPNIEAAVRLHDEVFRPLKREFPHLRLMIIGRQPHDRVLGLASSDVTVTGEVANIWEYINRIAVFAFPLSSGAGLQNKLLEAMYAGRPVVASAICSRSLGARAGVEILESHDSSEMRAHVRSLLSDSERRESLRLAGQKFVRENYEISRVIAQYMLLLFPLQ